MLKRWLPCPTTAEQWKEISKVFSNRWNFHHCLGALDGKHIKIQCPKGGGSLYYNYKGFHSVILMALVDADYRFIWVDVGSNGSAGDAQVFNGGKLKQAIVTGSLNFPPPDALPNDDKEIPYFIIGDDAFALQKWMMKPFSLRILTKSQRIYNYRLSRARRIVENAFGILAHRFRCLLSTMQQDPKNVAAITLTCITLHNLLRNKSKSNVIIEDQEDDGSSDDSRGLGATIHLSQMESQDLPGTLHPLERRCNMIICAPTTTLRLDQCHGRMIWYEVV